MQRDSFQDSFTYQSLLHMQAHFRNEEYIKETLKALPHPPTPKAISPWKAAGHTSKGTRSASCSTIARAALPLHKQE